MSYIPTIVIHIDAENDAKLLWKFLNNPQFPQLRNSNLNVHPKLKESIDKENFQEIVSEYVKLFYINRAQEIDLIYKRNKDIVEQNGTNAFNELARLMDYTWEKEITYHAYLSILTGSTFNEDVFTYSILGELFGKNDIKKSLLSVGIHEISHLIFFELLKPIEQKNKITLHPDGKYFLKEAVTTALLNTETLKSILQTEKDPGNPEIQKLYISTPQNSSILFIDYIKEQIIQSKQTNLPFNILLEQLAINTHFIGKPLNEKRLLWNKNGYAIFKNPLLLSEYEKPIPFINKYEN